MFKKVALVAVALAMVTPVFAKGGYEPPKVETGVTISNKGAFISNDVHAVGISGKNTVTSSFSLFGGNAGITTGAVTVVPQVSTAVNQFQSVNCGCSKVTVTNDYLKVFNDVSGLGISGMNKASGTVTTGAVVVEPVVSTVGNLTVFGDVTK